MSSETNALDEFFKNFNPKPEPLSNCCSAPAFGETFKNFGRCSECYEMAGFDGEYQDD